NTPELTLRHANNPDHFLDIEDLAAYGLKAEQLSPFRYEFIGQLAVARAAHPERFPTNAPGKENDRLQGIPGLLPWTINEYYAKLKSTFSSLKVYEELGTPTEISNARANTVYLMGVMGHYVGDSAQPLHTTKHFNGWVGENPHGYTTRKTFHSWIDGGYLRKIGGIDADHLRSRLQPAHSLWSGDPKAPHGDVFTETTAFLMEQFKQVEPLYQLDRDGKLSGEGEHGMEGRAFMQQQFIKAAQQLGNLWYSAWQQAVPDTYLKSQLTRRQPAQ
ncbi:MAG TPA: hypothetical protein VK968_12550, partial [Roseimicrobium sp.]|nr:hypothetical protein [Roseimicrobium sp.]